MLNVAIIGAGGAGSAAARFLAQEGHAVTIFEQFMLDHDQGSSYGASRIIRRTYPDALYTRMMGRAYDLWTRLEAEAGEKLFVRCGGLTFGREDNPIMAQTEEALRCNGVTYERLTAAEVMRRFPAFRLERDQYGIYQVDSGLLRASACVAAQMRLAGASGATLLENTPAQSVRCLESGGLGVAAGDGEVVFDRLLVAAGPWMTRLLPLLRLPLTVTRQYYAHLHETGTSGDFAIGTCPVWIDADTNFYGFPRHPDAPGVKIACHEHGAPTDPDQVAREPSAQDAAPLLTYAARRLPGLQGPPCSEKVCLYTNTPDEDFIIGPIPTLPGAFLCSGCSGHGFKFTVLQGRILADLATDSPVDESLDRFSLSRFSA